MKYFTAHKSLYAINIWRQSLIKLWYTPNAGAAAVSSTPNMVRGPSRALCETGCSEGGWYYCACALQVSPWLFRDGHKVSKERLGFPKVVSKCPLENPSPAIYSKSTLLCRALGTWPVPAAYSDPRSPKRNRRNASALHATLCSSVLHISSKSRESGP